MLSLFVWFESEVSGISWLSLIVQTTMSNFHSLSTTYFSSRALRLHFNSLNKTSVTMHAILHYQNNDDLNPANTRRWPNVGLILAHRLRRWPNLSPTLSQRLVFAWLWLTSLFYLRWPVHGGAISLINQFGFKCTRVITSLLGRPYSRTSYDIS